ncbi:DNA alkylation repair protein [Macrococcoides goetzii]|nr:DNA alkylation repair protein [Macrococcus goetzii]TDM49178.1 DNA alkylation repair protein [Macrococcus goetzii]
MITINDIRAAYVPLKNNEHQHSMESYMKNNFPFLGIKKSVTAPVMRELFKQGLPDAKEDVKALVNDCFFEREREYHYIGMVILNKKEKLFNVTDLDYIEGLLTTHSWWDSVDTIAPNIVGAIVLRERNIGEQKMREWNRSDNFWLKRASLLHQLKYKDKMNEALLTEFILHTKDEREFFIRKAIGWLLREYSKTNTGFVKEFVSTHHLSPLSEREALKWLKKTDSTD